MRRFSRSHYLSVLGFRDQLTNFAPGNKLDIVFLKQLAEGITGDKLEIALPPFSSPVRMGESHRSHLVIVVCQMHDQVCYTRLKSLYCIRVVLGPLLRSDIGLDADSSVKDNIVWAKDLRHKGCRSKPLLRNSDGQFVIACYSEQHIEEGLVLIKRAHMRIKVGGLNSKCPSARNLRANLCLCFFDINMRCGFRFRRIKVTTAI